MDGKLLPTKGMTGKTEKDGRDFISPTRIHGNTTVYVGANESVAHTMALNVPTEHINQ